MKLVLLNLCILFAYSTVSGQRITTIQLDGVQYFVSRMNPYSPELNYFLAYQYCRSLGLQLASFETKEKVESMTQYLQNAGYSKYDFWTSGNRLGTKMFLWMSTGLPFNATFDYFEGQDDITSTLEPQDSNGSTSPQRTARDSSSGSDKGCVILKTPSLHWAPEDCLAVKDFICEQTRCYYYNYGSIPVSSAQGRPILSTTTSTTQLPPILLSSQSKHASKSSPTIAISTRSFENSKEELVPSMINFNDDTKPSSTLTPSVISTIVASSAKVPITTRTTTTEPEITKIPEHEDHIEKETVEMETEEPLEKRLQQIAREVEQQGNMESNEHDIGRQSFFSLSDLIKTLRPNDKKTPQIDSDYSNTMLLLGEESKTFKENSENDATTFRITL